MKKKLVLCFGELLLRMSPSLNRKWIHDACLPVYIGGAELNVATALAKWNVPVKYMTALPDHFLSKEICEELTAKNIDVSSVFLSGNRIGTYYLAQGADLKHTDVIYDRAFSSFSELETNKINWDEILQDISWLHFSAISPALNANIAAVCEEALSIASSKKITISVDLNYRAKLWKWGKQPVEIMPALAQYCDVIMGNIWSANTLLGIDIDNDIHDKRSQEAYLQHAETTAKAIMQKLPKCKTVANTFRFDRSNEIIYYAALEDVSGQHSSPEFYTNTVVDKIGSGDCFMAGLIYGLLNEHTPQDVISFAAAAAFDKLHQTGDSTNSSVQDIQSKMVQHG